MLVENVLATTDLSTQGFSFFSAEVQLYNENEMEWDKYFINVYRKINAI